LGYLVDGREEHWSERLLWRVSRWVGLVEGLGVVGVLGQLTRSELPWRHVPHCRLSKASWGLLPLDRVGLHKWLFKRGVSTRAARSQRLSRSGTACAPASSLAF